MEKAARVEELTSGASGRIIPVFRNMRRSVPSLASLLRVVLLLHSLATWFLLLILRRNPISSRTAAASSPRRKTVKGRWSMAAEEEDVRRRREIAEGVEMVSPSEEMMWRGETSVFEGTRRRALFCRSWMPMSGDLRGIMLIIHGLNEHSGRYAHFAKQLMACNFGVYAMDWIGHGGSDGLHGYVPSLDHVVEDTGKFLEKIKSQNPDTPCFLFGHSTGGAVVLKAATFPHIEALVEGIILTSPAIRVKPAHPIVRTMAPFISIVLPKFQFKGANKKGIPVSRDPAAMLAKYSDPLVYTGPIRVRTGHEILRITSYLMQNLKYITLPFLVLHGTADRVTDPLASQDLYNLASSKHKNIKLYEGFLHDLLFEPERDEIGADIINWMLKRLQQKQL
ncbi:monoacylglycerol lipase-like [Zingiber officinale]|uniref:monoacylglycerol lipase-like n=1 Tax=Zingiber officinale TaxID=94328 RepID=UPI001C4DB5CC|nr:monoacylglycerol lipase-like [Zingiber officinale]